jgi:hypothetical protein
MPDFSDAVKSGDYRKSLVAIRDSIAARLNRPPCEACGFDSIPAADYAALMLRLTKVLETLDGLPPAEAKKLSGLAAIQARRGGLSAVPDDEPEVADTKTLGTRKAPRGARAHGNRPRINREA